mmetsp:Transcript_21648/g.50605  ORF Transcript_21648/g.50605 Transcript_21648/m.50605 type:complete len:645 (-) Transcript_21648:112-2046(-)
MAVGSGQHSAEEKKGLTRQKRLRQVHNECLSSLSSGLKRHGSDACCILKPEDPERKNVLQRVYKALATGSFINTMWGDSGTTLGMVQMAFIRMFFIWPLKAVGPYAVVYWSRRMCNFMKGRKEKRIRPVIGQGVRPMLRSLIGWSLSELLSWWLGSEVFFILYYLFKRRSLQDRARPPLMAPGGPLEVLRRSLAATDVIQTEGKVMDASYASPLISARPSFHDLQQAKLKSECSVEDLLRLQTMSSSANLLEEKSQKDDPKEIQELKKAEVAGWFLHRRQGGWHRWPASKVEELGRENVAQWMAWAFWNCEPHEVSEDRRAEMDQLIDEGEKWVGVKFANGVNKSAHSMRLTMDPIPSEYRPLIYYTVTALAFPIIVQTQLSRLGFIRHKSGTLAYWRRPGAADCTDPPLVFCHGVGVNLLPYEGFINVLIKQAPNRSIFLVSLPHISMHIHEDCPSSAEMVACLRDMLKSWGQTCGHFIGHSFGSLLVAWMCLQEPGCVSMATFIDPVCFLLVKPDVCFNFMYREPETPTQLLTHYFVARELYIAHSLSRNFFWNQNLLWPEDLKCPAIVVLSGQDSIVPAYSVRRYLAAFKRKGGHKHLRTMWFNDLGHGEINFGPVGLEACQAIVSEMLLMEVSHRVVGVV